MPDWDLDVKLEEAIDRAMVDDQPSLCVLVVLAREKAFRLAQSERREAA